MPLDGSSETLSKSRQSNHKNPYAVPRYRVMLVREGRAMPAREPFRLSLIHISATGEAAQAR